MVPNIARNGSSFRGAGAYHLHDKPTLAIPRPKTALRVAFTATRNLANDDAHDALDEMWRTARDAAHRKAEIGSSQRGRRNDAPVKSMSLSWAPSESPSHQVMFDAAGSFLRAMGWQAHQAVYAVHTDTAHPHLHIIPNRVHPDTGRTLNDWQERKRAQAWALAYERLQGNVLCTARLEPQYRSSAARRASHSTADQFARHAISRQIRAEFRPAWARHYAQQRHALSELAQKERATRRMAASLAREGDGSRALALLGKFERRRVKRHSILTPDWSAPPRVDRVRLRI